jgi:hypothetical protein
MAWTALGIGLVLLVLREPSILAHRMAKETYSLGEALWERFGLWCGAVGVLAIYSFLVRENPFYRLFEHILLGTAMAFGAVVLLQQVIIAKWWRPVFGAAAALIQGDASLGNPGDLWLILAGVVGSLWYFQFSKKYLWLNRVAVAVTMGAGAGLALKRSFFELLPQITTSFKPLFVTAAMSPDLGPHARWVQSAENIVFLTTTLSVLFYFFFVIQHRRAVVRGTARLGRWFLMLTLGAFFGNTFMTRLSALVERFHFLLSEWLLGRVT